MKLFNSIVLYTWYMYELNKKVLWWADFADFGWKGLNEPVK